MARRKIREYDGKRITLARLSKLLSHRNKLFMPRGAGSTSVQITAKNVNQFDKVVAENPWMKTSSLVAKPDVLFGKRGASGLVLLNASLEDCEKFCKKTIGSEVVYQGVKGELTHLIVEPFIPHTDEYYLSIASERDGNVIRFSPAGGIAIEENWGLVQTVTVPIDHEIDSFDLSPLFSGVTSPKALPSSSSAPDAESMEHRKAQLMDFVIASYKAFVDLDYTMLEMNPFTLVPASALMHVEPQVDENGIAYDAAASAARTLVVPLDMRVEVDSTAGFKSGAKWGDLEFPAPFGRSATKEELAIQEMDERSGASLKLTLLNPKGRIWAMVAGGGASVIYADTVADLHFAHELGNYGEYSGNPSEEEMVRYSSTLLELATRDPDGLPRALLIGGGIANFTDIAETFKGIIKSLRVYADRIRASNIKILVRRGGPNFQLGLKMMRELGEELKVPMEVYGPSDSMTSIVVKAIDWVKQSPSA